MIQLMHEIAITPPQISRFQSNLVQSLTVSSDHRWYTTDVQGQRSKVSVTT